MSEEDATGSRPFADGAGSRFFADGAESRPSADGAESRIPAGGVDSLGTPRNRTSANDLPDDLVNSETARARWMLRDDEFLLAEDREYVLRDDGRSWRGYVSPVLFGAVLAVMLGDVITTGVGMAMGLEEVNPVAATVIAEAGLGGLVLLKTMAAVVLLLLPGVTGDARRTFRAGSAAYLFVGLLVVAANAWAILAVAS